MKRPSPTILLASLLLAGALGLGVYQITSQQDDPVVEDREHQHEPASSRMPDNEVSVEDPVAKWEALSDHRLTPEIRLNLARRIDVELSQSEIDSLISFLRQIPDVDEDASLQQAHWLVANEVMEQMRRKGVGRDQLTDVFASLIENPKQSEVIRDYAVQHLSQWISPRGGGMPGEIIEGKKENALNVIAQTVIDPSMAHTSIPGTAIMSLTAVSSSLPPDLMETFWKDLDRDLNAMLKNEIKVPLSTKTTIIQSVAMRGSNTHLPLIQGMARDETIDPSLRLSSIAALGIYRSQEDRDYLQTLSQGKTRFRYAAQAALEKLTN